MEEWRDVEGYEELYEVSNLGDIRRKNKKDTTVTLKKSLDNNGFEKVKLSKEGKIKTHYIHRCVAVAFVRRDEEQTRVYHKDEDKQNNKPGNLEWLTIQEGGEKDNESTSVKVVLEKGDERIEFKSIIKASAFIGRSITYLKSRDAKELETDEGYRVKINIHS